MIPDTRLGRLAGILYLIVVVTGLFSLGYVPSQLSVHNDPLATLDRIAVSDVLFRYGVAAFLVEQVAYLLLALVLFRLLRSVDQSMAAVMVAFVVVAVPMALVALTHRLGVLSLLEHAGPDIHDAQLALQARSLLETYRNGLLLTSLFWGLWLFPLGYLVFQSGFLPKLLGIFLMLGCVGYVVDVFCSVLTPHYADMPISSYITLPAAIGEIGTCLWLLLFGTSRPFARRSGFPSAP
ncbi:MAG TPA: DUF4386 domain-containing protein [Dyella sp.]|uniref:DUF4386 domain-containing protein n=1 Tax=Dyella sp. TaxID=1869338 RepID=UPI002D788CF2|nr:DUF4386 domain-containing protein [Dyella sp.]HET6551928.1 DUF4386 domain-containing protein [Dyella sp.]